MQNIAAASTSSEPQFAALVDALAADPSRRGQLTDLLREAHPLYDQRGTATAVRMRGWVLLALARTGVSDAALLFVLEELDTGADAYLVAAAARALRSYPSPNASFAPFVMRALSNIRYRDDPVSFESYGEYAVASTDTSPVRELLTTLVWLGPLARAVLPEIESLRAQRGGFSRKRMLDLEQAIEAIGRGDHADATGAESCCALPDAVTNMLSWARSARRGCEPIASIVFEDHDGASITFKQFFWRQPSIVVFFYTRCDNPLKCSLTVTKLARVQELLAARGLADHIHTAAITYDPAFDLPARLRGYGLSRGLRMDDRHRVLRAMDGVEALRRHFRLGVNFIESLVNRHRVEAYILDAGGRIAASFERIHWDEERLVERAIEVLNEERHEGVRDDVMHRTLRCTARRHTTSSVFGALPSLGVALFPKCPTCWAGYLSVFGVTGLQLIPYSPWLQSMLVALMLVNLASVWVRARATGRMTGFCLVSAGALAILISKISPSLEEGVAWGLALTLAGSFLSALGASPPSLNDPGNRRSCTLATGSDARSKVSCDDNFGRAGDSPARNPEDAQLGSDGDSPVEHRLMVGTRARTSDRVVARGRVSGVPAGAEPRSRRQ